jgi:signal recognition particle subunit SEC65
LAEVRAALLIVQSIRFDPNENPRHGRKANRPREVLQTYAKAIAEAIRECNLSEPHPKDVQQALEGYRMFTEIEIARLVAELPQLSARKSRR